MCRLPSLGNGWADCVEILICTWRPISYSLCNSHGWGISARAHVHPPPLPSPYVRIRLTNFAQIWCVAIDPIVTRFTKVGGGVTAHSHVRLQFRCLGNRSALTLKPHLNKTYLFRARSFIAKHGVLLVLINFNKPGYSLLLTVYTLVLHSFFIIFIACAS